MAATTSWAPGFSGSPNGAPLSTDSIIEMLGIVGSELVAPPGDPNTPPITRRELLARVLWTRALIDADGAAAKLIIEYLDGKPGETAAMDEVPALTADDMALAEKLLHEAFGDDQHTLR